MNIRQHLIPISIKRMDNLSSDKCEIMRVVYNYLPATMYKNAQSHVVLEQSINETVPVYKDAIDYIVCQLRSTVQHEAQHRAEEMEWQQEDPEKRMTFEQLTNPSRAEVGPEQAEENCIPPEIISGQVEMININELFERAKAQANIDPSWKSDIMAATLAEGRAGEYLMKSLSPDDLVPAQQVSPGVFRHGNNLLIDVRKHIEPWIVQQQSLPSNVQTGGDGAVTRDVDAPKIDQTQEQSLGTVPVIPSVPTI